MKRYTTHGEKRFQKRWLIILFVCAGIVLFYKPLLLMGCKAVLNGVIPKTQGQWVSYEKMQWEEGVIAISGLQIKDPTSELTVDRIELQWKGDLFHFRLQPQVTVVHPQIVFSTMASPTAPMLPFLYRTRFIQPRWDIRNGVVQLPDEMRKKAPSATRFYFSLVPGEEEGSIGNLLFSYDPSPLIPAMISAELAMHEGILQAGFKLRESELRRLLPLTALIFPEVSREWEKAEGEIECEGLMCFSPSYEIQEVHCRGAGKNIDLRGPAMGIDMQSEEIRGAFSYPVAETEGSFWDKLSASLYLKSDTCSIGAPLVEHPLGMKALVGELTFEPREAPKLTLSGALVQDEQRMPFTLSGKGGVQQDHTFWSELELNCNAPHGHSMQALVSLCSHDGADLVLHLKIENAAFEHLDFIRSFSALPGQCVEGKVNAEATLLYKEGHWQKASVDMCCLENIRWYFPDEKITVYAEQITGDSAWEKKGRTWGLADLHLQCIGGDYLDPLLHVEKMATELAIEKGLVQPSQMRGEWGGLQGEVSFLSGDRVQLTLKGEGRELVSFLSKADGEVSLPIDIQAEAKMSATDMRVTAEATVAEELVKGSAVFALSSFSIPELLLGNLPDIQFREGQFQADHLTEKSYGIFIPYLFSDIDLGGKLQCTASLTPARIQVALGGEELIVKHAWADLCIPHLKEKAVQFSYDVAQRQWRGEGSLTEAQLHDHALGLDFDNLEGTLKLEGERLKAASFYAECQGLALRGNLDLSLAQGKLSLCTSQIAGDMKSLLSVLSHVPSLPPLDLPIDGDFSSGDKGFVLTASMGAEDAVWNFKGTFGNLCFPLNASTSITGGRCEVQFDSKTHRLSVEKGEGIWQLKEGMPLTVQVKQFSSQADHALDFALKIVDGKKEFAHFEGHANKTDPSHWHIAFDGQRTHFAGAKLNITRCLLNAMLKPVSFEMKPSLKCQDLHAQAAFLQNAGFLPLTFSTKNLQDWKLEGTLQTHLCSEDLDKGFSFRAESRDLKVKGKSCDTFHLKGQKIGEKWLIEKLDAGALSLKGAFLVDATGLSVPGFEGSWKGASMKGSGRIKAEKEQLSCTLESFKIELQTPLPMTGTSLKTIKLSYGDAAGLFCDGLDFQIKHRISNVHLANLKAARVVQPQEGNLSFQQLQFSLTSALLGHCIDAKLLPSSVQGLEWEGNLEGSGDLLLGLKGNAFQGTLKPGRYGMGGKSLLFDQLQVRYEKEALMVRAKTKIEEQPLWSTLQIDLKKEPYGAVTLFDHPKAEGMQLLFTTQAGKISWESIQGSCYGVSCNLSKSTKRKIPLASALTGEIKVDGNQIRSLLPDAIKKGMESFKLGSGYQWQGDLVVWQEAHRGFQANGILRGSEFEAFGYRFQHLEGILEANPAHVFLSNIKIDDPAGTVSIKKIELNKQEEWQLYIPQIAVRQLQPSLMRKADGEPQVLKPFTIQDFTMAEIRGRMGDQSTLEGSGRLSFVNQFKKEASLFDIPFEMIKKIGLDPGLLTPIQGELEMELRGDKFYLTALQNSFSEGRRSEFYLAPNRDLSYIDLDGKVHIDLNMRQDVVLKITEPFTLTIRGTLDKPRYGLQ